MKKLQLNKRTIAQMDRVQMSSVKGGAIKIPICLHSCPSGSRKSKSCCDGEERIACLEREELEMAP